MIKYLILVVVISLVAITTLNIEDASAFTSSKSNEFVIGLESNSITSSSPHWYASFDSRKLELLERWYVEDSPQDIPSNWSGDDGTTGITYFRFKSLRTGWTRLSFTYQESQGSVIDRKVFRVRIL